MEAFPASVADSVSRQLNCLLSPESEVSFQIRPQLKVKIESFRQSIAAIGPAIVSARPEENKAEERFLSEIGGLLYDAEDILDDLVAEAEIRGVTSKASCRLVEKLCICFAAAASQFFATSEGNRQIHLIEEKIRAVLSRLEASPPIHVDDVGIIAAEPTSSLAVDLTYEEESGAGREVVIGRDNDKEKVVDFLLSNNHSPESPDKYVPILPIVGIQGIGKTTLARLVFCDKSVINQFEMRIWITVSSGDSILEVVAKEILQQTHDGSAPLEIHEKDNLGLVFAGKRFLLVLDDVRVHSRSFLDLNGGSDSSYYQWYELLSLLKAGAYGSKILVTSRDMRVTELTFGEHDLVYELKCLSEKESLSLLTKVAAKELESNSIKEILSKCAGVPLAIITAGRNLWISGNNRPRLENGGGLKETYDLLPLHLKHCVACCSLLPRDSVFNVHQLINLWKAHRFLRSSEISEKVGQEFVRDLVSLFIFHDLVEDDRGVNILACKMHPLIHDVARLLTKRCYNLVENSNAQLFLQGDAALDHNVYISMEQDPLEVLERAKNARVLVFLNNYKMGHIIGEPVVDYICINLKKLRTLRLQRLSVSAVSDLLGTLRHLRHLDLSESSRLEALPGSIGKLLNLETLILDNCCSLKELPKGIIKLIKLQELDLSGCSSLTHLPVSINQLLSLRELDLSGCSSLTLLPTGITQLVSLRKLDLSGCSSLTYLPSGFKSLKNLETLALFLVGEEEDGIAATINELAPLRQLNGHLEIKNLHRVASKEANGLPSNSKFQSLKLCWDSSNVRARGTADSVLRGFLPHYQSNSISEISIQGYCGYHMEMFFEIACLVKIDIGDCNWCTDVSLVGEFPKLKSVELREMRELEYLLWNSHDFFPALEVLTLNRLHKLKGWKRWNDDAEVETEGDDLIFPVFSTKIHLDVHHTPIFSYGHGRDYLTLATLTDHFLRRWVGSNINGKGNASSSSSVVNLHSFSLPGENKARFTSINSVSLDQLRTLKIYDMSDIRSLPDDFFKQLSSLQHLEINHGRFLSTLSGAMILQHLTALETFKIVEFPELDFSTENNAVIMVELGSANFKGGCSKLRQVRIAAVPKMESLPWWFQHLTELNELVICKCVSLRTLQDDCISKFGSLRSFEVHGCKALGSISKGVIIHLISNLESLKISGCPELDLTASPAEDIITWQLQTPSRLRHLHIQQNDRMNHLPWWIQHLVSLEILEILFCKNLEALPQWFPELLIPLKELRIEYVGSCQTGATSIELASSA